MRMVWKGTKTVGFGKRGKYIVAWYCSSPPDVDNSSDAKTNVKNTSTCLD